MGLTLNPMRGAIDQVIGRSVSAVPYKHDKTKSLGADGKKTPRVSVGEQTVKILGLSRPRNLRGETGHTVLVLGLRRKTPGPAKQIGVNKLAEVKFATLIYPPGEDGRQEVEALDFRGVDVADGLANITFKKTGNSCWFRPTI